MSTADDRGHVPHQRKTVLENSNGGNGNSGGVASTEFKTALGKFASGVTVVTIKVGGITRGMTVSAFFSLSMDPPLVAVAVHKQSKLHSHLQEATDFGISILASHQANLSDHFAGRRREVADIQFAEVGCVPVIEDALVHLCCAVAARYDGGDHTIYIGLVRDLKHREDCEALVYFSGNYRTFDSTAMNNRRRPTDCDTRTETARVRKSGQAQ